MSFKLINKVIIGILAVILSSSCTRYRDLVLLQQPRSDNNNVYKAVPPIYKIQNGDVLYIRVLSLNQEVTQVINATSATNTNQFTNDASFFIYGYNVSDSGYIELPVIGKVFVLGKTLEDAKNAISKQTSIFLKDATVIVKLISFKYSILGEVKSPGVYQNYNNQLTVLEAIGHAGDITAYGNRHKIMVIRPGPENTKTFRLDITKTDILNSEGFFLLPNDVVYVEPVKSYNFKTNIQTIALFLSGISTLILVLNYINYN
jgi:polysaccharide export outer membrane protein